MSSWLGTSILSLGEWFIKRMPFVRHIYNASKQISVAISPGTHWFLHSFFVDKTFCFGMDHSSSNLIADQNTQAFKEVAIIRHPRIGEYAFGFITSSLTLQVCHVLHLLHLALLYLFFFWGGSYICCYFCLQTCFFFFYLSECLWILTVHFSSLSR